MDLGFDSDDMDDTDGDTSSLVGSPDKSKPSFGDDEALNKLLEVERAALVEAKSDLAESESKNRALQRKFDQLKSSSTGQLGFMKKKLEAQYQNTVDGMEAELEESRDECEALRMQMQQLIEHMEASGAAAPAQLVAATETSGDSRHLDKLKKELVKKDETLRRYEQELASIRSTQILPAAAECAAAATGVQELQRQLEASQAEVARARDELRKSSSEGGGGGSSQLEAEVARLTQELRVAKMQAASATPAAAPTTTAVSARAPHCIALVQPEVVARLVFLLPNASTTPAFICGALTPCAVLLLIAGARATGNRATFGQHRGPDEDAQPDGKRATKIKRGCGATSEGREPDE